MVTECNEWVDKLMAQLANGKQYKRLIQQCIVHLKKDKKLYKYYDLNSEYTFDNVSGSINYYNNPVAFNDPFDCNIGISSDQFLRVLLPGVFDQVYQSTIDPALKRMIETKCLMMRSNGIRVQMRKLFLIAFTTLHLMIWFLELKLENPSKRWT